MANRRSTFLLKRSNVAGKKPSAGDLLLGELAINMADGILYTSGTTAGSILPIGWDRVARTGDTMTGTLFAPSISATTISAETITLKNYIDFNTGTTTPTNISGRVFYDNQSHSLAYFPDINQNVKIEVGQQLYIRGYNNTGSVIPKGTALSIQSATNGLPNFTPAANIHRGFSQVIGLAASDIPINGNGLALSQGILSGITINSFNIGDILYASPFSAGTYVANTSSFPFSARTNQIGFVIATGTSTGEIYVNINNEDENITLTDIERNILEGNVISTGLYEFTGMTTASTTTFNIAPLKGWLVKNTYEYATLPDVLNLIYTGGTNISVTNIATADSTYILITSALTVTQQTTFPTPQQRRENIYLGKVNHPNRTSILNINNTVDYDVSPMSALRDLWSPIKYINQGIIPSPNGANLSFNTSAGTLWGNGINWHNNQLNPNSVSISGKTPASFNYRTQTGGTSSSVTVIDPTKYDVGGVITSISPAGSNDATNQRIYLYPTGIINVLYGQTRYATLSEAVAAIQSETFIPYPNAETTGILIGVISVRNDIVADGQPLTNPDYAKFTLVSKFGESFGGTGGLSTTTLQQAYNNSTTPEIVINATLDGLTIKNGTGNADNVTRLIEGQTATNGITSFIRADGYISGTTFQSNGFIANSDGLTGTTIKTNGFTANTTGLSASTISATTYYNLPTDIFTTGGTYSNITGIATFTNNSGGTFNVAGFSTGGGSVFTGGTVTGPTTFIAGLTANTISATTYQGLPTDVFTTGGTYSNGTATFRNNTGGTFTVTGFSTGTSLGTYLTGASYSNNVLSFTTNSGTTSTVTINTVTGLTSSGTISSSILSATTYQGLPTDVYVTGGTYSTGTTTFRNSTGGTFTVTGYSTGTTTNIGGGTANYLARWTGSTGLSNSIIQDDGTNIGINTTPSSTSKVLINTVTTNQIGILGQSYYIGVKGLGSIDNGTVYGVYGVAQDNGNPFVTSVYIGGRFLAGGGSGTNYGVQIQDGSEGLNKVLVSQTSDGKANWTNTLSGLTAVYTTNLTVTASTQSLFSGASSVEMVKIIQAGSGDAFVVEDQDNGDASHFVINASGNTAIGLTQPIGNDKLTVSGNTSIYGAFNATSISATSITADTVTTFIPELSPYEIYRGVTFQNNSTTVTTFGGVTMSTSASNSAQSVASTNFVSKQIRLRYFASVVSGGRYTGTRGSALLWFIGGGFRYVCDFNISDTAFASACQQFYGLANQTTDLAYGGVGLTQVSTLTNLIGLGNDGADTNLQIMHNDSGGTATKIDLGVNFPANRTAGSASTTVYSLTLYNAPASNTVKYMVVNNETGAVAMGTITTNLPDSTLGLNFFASRAMGGGGGVTNSGQFDLLKLGVNSLL